MSKLVDFKVFAHNQGNTMERWLRPSDHYPSWLRSMARFEQSFEKDENSPTVFSVNLRNGQPLQVTNQNCFFRYYPVYGMCLAPGKAVQQDYANFILAQSKIDFSSLSEWDQRGKFCAYFGDQEVRNGSVIWWDTDNDLVWSVSPELLALTYARLRFKPDAETYRIGDEVSAILPLSHYPNDVARWRHVTGTVCSVGAEVSIRSEKDRRVIQLPWEYLTTKGTQSKEEKMVS